MMQYSASAAPRKSFELPREEGLAEWTSRIKAIQHQVDADEEAEQKKLEQEIAASRLARQRRSRGFGYGGLVGSPDQARNSDYPTSRQEESSNHNDPVDRCKRQEALNKLSGVASYRSTGLSSSTRSVAPPLQSKSSSLPPDNRSSEPISLAAFMGGRVAGPRLNKHAPQQDVHDPTQFEQRTRVNAPHPVFGRGGIAMPGLVPISKTSPSADSHAGQLSDGVDKPSWSTSKRLSTTKEAVSSSSPFFKHYTEPFQSAPESTLPPVRRERTVSTPNRSASKQSSLQTLSQEDHSVYDMSRRPVSQSSLPPSVPRATEVPMKTQELHTGTSESRLRRAELRPKTPESSHGIPDNQSRSTDMPRNFGSVIGSSPPQPTTPPFSTPRTVSTSTSPRKSPVTAHSLARYIQPDPRFSPLAPLISASQSPSPAFLRPPPQKDLTPSISRLQGRGFVQSMVKVSSQMESMATGSKGSPTSSEKTRPSNTKKPSVLDRWPAGSPKQDISSPFVAPNVTSSPNANVRHVVSSSPFPFPSPVSSKEIKPPDFRKSLKPASSLPSISKAEATVSSPKHPPVQKRRSFTGQMPPEGSPGLGSSSTLVSYIKPLKTGDDPLIMPELTPSLEVTELGMRATSPGTKPSHPISKAAAAWERSTPPGKPLSHPTRDRVRKLRKVRDGQNRSEDPENAVDHKLDIVAVSSEGPRSFTSTSPPTAPPLQEPPSAQQHDRPEPIGHIKNSWTHETIIGVKPFSSPQDATPRTLTGQKAPRNAMPGRVALPGLVSKDSQSKNENESAVRQQPPSLQQRPYTKPESTDINPPSSKWSSSNADTNSSSSNLNAENFTSISLSVVTRSAKSPTIASSPKDDRPQVITARHTRMQSSGTRATAMEIAQALDNQPLSSPGWKEHRADPSSWEENLPKVNSSEVEVVAKTPTPNRRSNVTSTAAIQAEKRKSSYEKYSAIMLPPLKEEATPLSSPAGTLTRTVRRSSPEAANQEIGTKEVERKLQQVFRPGSTALSTVSRDMVYFNHVDEPLPPADIEGMIASKSDIQRLNPDMVTVSVEVMVVIGNTATALRRDTTTFYDSEVLAIIHRSKSKSSGLVSTSVYGWWGRRRQVNDKEQHKLQELAKRYGTVLETVLQCSEPLELVRVLGGQLAIRQGSRSHWSSENTAMHLIRQSHGMILIDEHDLSVRNLCSGFSYCISILETIYVWYGRGSTTQERQAALAYARGLAPNADCITQLTEAENDHDEMFWMILGDDDYAKANYWQWRPSSMDIDPCLWRIEMANNQAVVSTVSSLSREADFLTSVYVADCVWEFFVLVAKDARGKRPEIQLAISIATRLSNHVAASRPYRPTVHVLVLPSQLPLEFQLSFRDIDEALLNDGFVPEHMNLLSLNDALQHLRRNSWNKDALKDDTMLPLGLHSADV